MIEVKIAFDDERYYEISDQIFVDKAEMTKLGKGLYSEAETDDSNAILWSSYYGILDIFKVKGLLEHISQFTRTVDDEESDLFDFRNYLLKSYPQALD